MEQVAEAGHVLLELMAAGVVCVGAAGVLLPEALGNEASRLMGLFCSLWSPTAVMRWQRPQGWL